MTTLQEFRFITTDLNRSLRRVADQPAVAREIDYFKAEIQKIDSVESFINSPRLFRFAMTAFGLEDMVFAKAFMRKALEQGVSRRDSFANRLVDPRVREFAKAFDFAEKGSQATKVDGLANTVISNFLRQTLEAKTGEKSEGARLALYFQRKAPVLNSPLEVLADKAVSQVVRTALGLPEQSARQDLDQQVRAISQRVDVKAFRDPAVLNRFLERFAAKWDAGQPTSESSLSVVPARADMQTISSLAATLTKNRKTT